MGNTIEKIPYNLYKTQGDISEVKSGYILHGVNCMGVMGSEDIKDHRKNTEAAGIPTRDLYAAPAVKESLTSEPAPTVITSAADLVEGKDYWVRALDGETARLALACDGFLRLYYTGWEMPFDWFDGNYIAEPIAAPKFVG